MAQQNIYTDLLKRLRTPNKHGELVLEGSYRIGDFDSHAVDSPFPFRYNGRFYMTYIGFDGSGYQTGLASSDDLVHWSKEGLILGRGLKGSVTENNAALTWILRDNEVFGSGELKKVNGRWLGTYHAYPGVGYEVGAAAIGVCWSDDMRHWEVEEPCIRASDPEAGEWERGGLYKSCIIEHNGAYYLFYNAKTTGDRWVEQIGFAVSRDLKRWTRHPANPVIVVGAGGSFDDTFCSDPCVLICDGTWVMFYYALSSQWRARDSVAFSDDLVNWRKSGKVMVDAGPQGSVDSFHAHKPGVIASSGRLYHFYCAVGPSYPGRTGEIDQNEVRGISLCTS